MAVELTARLVVDGRRPLVARMSPDGRWVACVVEPVGREPGARLGELLLVRRDGTAPPRAVADQATAPRWQSDDVLYFVTGGEDLCRLDVTTGDVEVVASRVRGLVDHLPLAEPGLVALIVADVPGDREVVVRTDPQPGARLTVLETATGASHPLPPGDRHVVEVAQRPGGGPLAVLSWSTPAVATGCLEAELHVVDPVDRTVTPLGPAGVEAMSPTWWHGPDGWHVAHLAVTPPALVGGYAVLDTAVPPDGRPGPRRNLTAGLPCCPVELVGGDGLLALCATGLDTTVHRFDPVGRAFTPVHRIGGLAESLSADRRGDVVAAVVSTAYRPADVHAGPVGGSLTRITDTRPELDGVLWGRQERLAHEAVDGLPLDGLLVLPAGARQTDGPFPLVTLVHGGPYSRHADRLALDWFPSAQWLATDGFAVFLPNPRGSQGRGHGFAAAVAGAVGVEEWSDVLTGVDLLVARGVADPGRLGIGGWSHGGFLAAWAIGRTDRFRAAFVGAGISDWGMLVATGEAGPLEAALCGGAGWDGVGPHRHDLLSPVSYASRVRTPVLVAHGEDDTNVPVSQAEHLHRALRHFGVPHEYVVYPREGHAISGRAAQLDLLHRTRAWFRRWLVEGGAAPSRSDPAR